MIEDWWKLPIFTRIWFALMLALPMAVHLEYIRPASMALQHSTTQVADLRCHCPQSTSEPVQVTIWNYFGSLFYYPVDAHSCAQRGPKFLLMMLLLAVSSSKLESQMVGGRSRKLYFIGIALNAVASLMACIYQKDYLASISFVFSVMTWACYKNRDMVILPTTKYPEGVINLKYIPSLVGLLVYCWSLGAGRLEFTGIWIGMMTYYIIRIFDKETETDGPSKDLPNPENVAPVKPVFSFSRMTMVRIRGRKIKGADEIQSSLKESGAGSV